MSAAASPAYASAGVYSLSAAVDSNGSNTYATIKYGPTTSYGSTSSIENVPNGTTETFSRATASLAEGSTVHYRAQATNSFGTTYGPDQTYVVGGKPQVTASVRPKTVNAASRYIRLYGSVQSNQLATTAQIEFGTTSSLGSVLNAGPVPAGTEKTVNILQGPRSAGSVVYYRTKATNAAGTTLGPIRKYVYPEGFLRPVYMYPTDRAYNEDYYDSIVSVIEATQEFYAKELITATEPEGKTFTTSVSPIVCALPQNAAYYGTVDPDANGVVQVNGPGSWQKLKAALQVCGVVDDYSDNIIYADIPGTCDPGNRIGAGIWTLGPGSPPLAIMGDGDLQGLNGSLTVSSACDSHTYIDSRGFGRFQGGAAHEIGHTFHLEHASEYPSTECPQGVPNNTRCSGSLMSAGWQDLSTTYLLDADKAILNASPFFS